MLLAGLAGAATGYAAFANEQAKQQAELDKEQRVLDASKELYRVQRDDKAADHNIDRSEKQSDIKTAEAGAIRKEIRIAESAKTLEQNNFNLNHSPERQKILQAEAIANKTVEDKYADSRFPIALNQFEQKNAITDHFSQTEQDKKEAIMQVSLDVAKFPEAIKEDNKVIRDELASNKAQYLSLQTAGTLTPEAAKQITDRNDLLFSNLHANIKPYLPAGKLDPQGINEGQSKYSEQINSAAEKYGVPQQLFSSLVDTESSGQQFDKNNKPIVPVADGKIHTNVGLTQVSTKWFPQYDAEKLRNDPQYNANAGAEILKGLYDKTDIKLGNTERWHQALQGYHDGPSGAGNAASIDYANTVTGKWSKANEAETSRILASLNIKKEEAPIVEAAAVEANPGLLTDATRKNLLDKAASLNPNFDVSGLSNKDLQIAINRRTGKPDNFALAQLNPPTHFNSNIDHSL